VILAAFFAVNCIDKQTAGKCLSKYSNFYLLFSYVFLMMFGSASHKNDLF